MLRRTAAALAAAALVLTGTAACSKSDSGGSSTSSSSSSSSSIQGLTVTGKFGQQPTVKVHGLAESSPKSDTVIQGSGQKLTSTSTAKMQVLMAKGTDGSTIQSSYTSGQPQSLQLSTAPQWVQDALSGARVGDRVAYVTPISAVNNGKGAPDLKLKAKDDLVVVIDVLSVAPPPLSGPKGKTVTPPADAPKVVEKNGTVTALDFSHAPKKAPSSLKVIPLVQGTGPAVKQGDTVTVNYLGTVWGNGSKPFDSSWSHGQPASFQLVQGGLIDGWVKGLDGVKVGSRVLLEIPPKDGYGAKGSPPKIPGNASLAFVVDVLGAS
jgi:peptidylprolyl isomerase